MTPLPQTLEMPSNDYHLLPPSARQMRFAQDLAARTGRDLPGEVMTDRLALSGWIDRHHRAQGATRPSAKQVAFAERIARRKRRNVPPECFQDRTLMSRWIDHNK